MNLRFENHKQSPAQRLGCSKERNSYETSIKLRKTLKSQEISKRFQNFRVKIDSAKPFRLLFDSQNTLFAEQVNTLELELMKSEPDYQSLISSGTINFLANFLQTVKNPEDFQAVLKNLANFCAGPKFCSEYLEKLQVIQCVIKKIDIVGNVELAGWVVLFFSNLITSFDGFFDFMKADGILKVKNFAQGFGFSGEILKYLECLCFNLSFFSSELGEFDGKIIVNLIEKFIESGQNEEMLIEMLELMVRNPSAFEFTEVIVGFLVRSFKQAKDSKKLASLMTVIENSSANSFHNYTKDEFYQIFSNIEKVLNHQKLFTKLFTMLKSLLKDEENAAVVLNSNLYSVLAQGFSFKDEDVRIASLKFFTKVFKSVSFSSCEVTLMHTFYEELFSGFDKRLRPEEVLVRLQLLRVVLTSEGLSNNLKCHYGDSCVEFILEVISRYSFHPNEKIADEVLNVQELLYY